MMLMESKARALAASNKDDGNLLLPDDMMWLIMLRCPVKSTFRFKCVSKTWHRSLSDPSFREAYISFRKAKESQVPPPPLLGFFNFMWNLGKVRIPNPEPQGFSFLPTSTEGEPLTRLDFVDRVGSFISISNGLILCGDYPNFHVFNPVTRQLFSLPPSPFHFESIKDSFGIFIYEAATPGFVSSECDNDFKVIVPIVDRRHVYRQKFMLFWIYFSETGLWKELVLVAPDCFQVFPGVLCTSIGGTVFWYASAGGVGCHLLAYDPDGAEDRVQLINLPKVRCITNRHPTLCQSSDGFLQCNMDTHELPGFRVYALANKLATYGYDDVVSSKEWILIYDVRLDMLDAIWTGWLQRCRHRQHDRYVVRMAYHPLNPLILFFRMGHRIYCCDVENGVIDLIPYEGRHFYANDYFMLRPYVQPYWPPSPLPKGV